MDQFIANGVAFTNPYATTPVCVPARRELMTGTFSRAHGVRDQPTSLPVPAPTLAQAFRDAGYQAYAVGKLHVSPQRDRIGFDDVMLNEEGRAHQYSGAPDDYEHYLTQQGHSGEEFAHGVTNNEFSVRTWHLPERLHSTNWTAREMSKLIVRRDPTRPAFWYMSFTASHPPLTPLSGYLDSYHNVDVGVPLVGEWAQNAQDLPYPFRMKNLSQTTGGYSEDAQRLARQAYYAMCTHVDHQIRRVLGTLREEGLHENTIIMFTADHGEMLGNHGVFGKTLFYEDSARIPMLLVPTPAQSERIGYNRHDVRLAAQADVMPTLLELCDIPAPETLEGLSLVGERRHGFLYGDLYEGPRATRMVHDGRHKLIYYAAGNRTQLFDLADDPDEMLDRAGELAYAEVRERLIAELVGRFYGSDLDWVEDGQLVGLPYAGPEEMVGPDWNYWNQRGRRFR